MISERENKRGNPKIALVYLLPGLPKRCTSKESTCQRSRHRRCRFDPWVGKVPWRRKWQPSSSSLAWRIPCSEEPDGLQSKGCKQWDTAEHAGLSTHCLESFYAVRQGMWTPEVEQTKPGSEVFKAGGSERTDTQREIIWCLFVFSFENLALVFSINVDYCICMIWSRPGKQMLQRIKYRVTDIHKKPGLCLVSPAKLENKQQQ